MIIRTGSPSSDQWRLLEVAPNQQPDILASRLSREIKHIHENVEILLPFTPNANGEPEWIVEHIYVRGANGSLPRISHVPGIESIRPEIPGSDWLNHLMTHESKGSIGLRTGQFVRVLSGTCGGMCGDLRKCLNGTATVQIKLLTKTLTCYTYPENVQSLSVPKAQRTFFYLLTSNKDKIISLANG